MANTDKLQVEISADVSDLKAGLERANDSLETLKAKAKKAGDSVGGLAKKSKLAALSQKGLGKAADYAELAVGALGAATLLLVKNQITATKTTDLWSKKLGIANTSLSKVTAAGAKFGLEAETIADAMKDLNVRITDAAGGATAYEEIFVKLGLSTKQLIQLNPEQQFLMVADAISKADANTRRWALDEINDSMFRLGPLMEQGSKGIIAMGKAAAETGAALSTWEFEEIKKVNQALIETQAATTALGNALAIHLGPGLELAAKWATSLAGAASDLLGTSEAAMKDRLVEINTQMQKLEQNFEKAGRRRGSNPLPLMENQLYISLLQERLKLENATASKVANVQGGPDPLLANMEAYARLPVAGPLPAPGFDAGQKGKEGEEGALSQAEQEAKAVAIGLQAAADARQVYAAQAIIDKIEQDRMMAEAEAIGLQAAADARQEFAAIEAVEKAEQYLKDIEANRSFWDVMLEVDRDAMKASKDLWESGWKGKQQLASKFMGQMSQLMNTNSRKQFEIGKAAAIAQVAIDTPKTAMAAYSSMAGIPIIGPALGIASAGAAIATGVSQMQNIKNQSFGSGSAGGGGGIQGAGAVDAGGAGGVQETQTVSNFDVNLQGESFSGEQIRGLIDQINGELDDGATIGRIGVR